MVVVDNINDLIHLNLNSRIAKIEVYPLKIINDNNNKYYYYFCGAVLDCRGHIIGIPNGYPHILDIDPENCNIEQWGEVLLPEKKGWTGGGLASDGKVYAFPRGANSILQIDTLCKKIEYLHIPVSYSEEHHYGGVINNKDVIYQPPRFQHNVLKYDIKKCDYKEIALHDYFRKKFLYYGGMMDKEGNGYFFPSGRYCKVCMVDTDGNVELIGKRFGYARFNSGAMAANGHIYGFSTTENGILHIDTNNKNTEIILNTAPGGYYGAKLAFNGRIYGIPGNSDNVIEFDPQINKITDIIPLPDIEKGTKAKCAGGAIDKKGNIWCVPAKGHYIYKISFKNIMAIPSDELYNSAFFRSYY